MSSGVDSDPTRIEPLLAALGAAWRRNPNRTLVQIVDRATQYTEVFVPGEITDRRLLYGLLKLGPGRPVPTSPGSADEVEVLKLASSPSPMA